MSFVEPPFSYGEISRILRNDCADDGARDDGSVDAALRVALALLMLALAAPCELLHRGAAVRRGKCM